MLQILNYEETFFFAPDSSSVVVSGININILYVLLAYYIGRPGPVVATPRIIVSGTNNPLSGKTLTFFFISVILKYWFDFGELN